MGVGRRRGTFSEPDNPDRTNIETDLSSLLDPKFTMEVMKILKELRRTIDRNSGHCNKELETIKKSHQNWETHLPG